MSRRRRQSPARPGHLRSTFARSVARAAAPRWARSPRSSRSRTAESVLVHAPIDRKRQFALGHPARTLVEHVGCDPDSRGPLLSARRSRSHPSRRDRFRRSLRSRRARLWRPPTPTYSRATETVDGEVRGLEADAGKPRIASRCASVASYEPSTTTNSRSGARRLRQPAL